VCFIPVELRRPIMKHTPTPITTARGGEEIPPGTFHAGGVVQCSKCGHWFAIDGYAWRMHRRSCTGK
jgi:hypothetical protein